MPDAGGDPAADGPVSQIEMAQPARHIEQRSTPAQARSGEVTRTVHFSPVTASPSSAGFSDEIYPRLALVAFVYAGVYAVMQTMLMLSGSYEATVALSPVVSNAVAAVSVGLSLGVGFLARSRKLGAESMINISLWYEVAGAIGIDAFLLWTPMGPDFMPLGISWVNVWLLCFVLIVPCSPGRALLASLATASTTPLLLLISVAAGVSNPSGSAIAQIVFPNYVSVGIAFALAQILNRMRQQVREARALGSYRLVELLGRGGMGEVWLGRHQTLARPAAIKLIRPSALGSLADPSAATAFRRFEREAQTTASLRSVHTIQLYDFGISDDGCFYYVMELLEGLDLERLVARFGPLPPARVVYFLRQACHSLEEAHRKGLVHRDIKPANIYACRLGPDVDFVKVLDFGLVKSAGREAHDSLLTQAGAATGTPAYMAPELALSKPDIDGRADIYSLGCVAYWLLTGRLVFEASSAVEMAMHHVQSMPLPPAEVSELEVHPELNELVLACLAKHPGDRPNTMRELAGRLDHIMAAHAHWDQEQASAWWRTNLPELGSDAY